MLGNQMSSISYGSIKLKGIYLPISGKISGSPWNRTASVFLMALQDEHDSQGLGQHSLGKS